VADKYGLCLFLLDLVIDSMVFVELMTQSAKFLLRSKPLGSGISPENSIPNAGLTALLP
jgi:hypothetical protein